MWSNDRTYMEAYWNICSTRWPGPYVMSPEDKWHMAQANSTYIYPSMFPYLHSNSKVNTKHNSLNKFHYYLTVINKTWLSIIFQIYHCWYKTRPSSVYNKRKKQWHHIYSKTLENLSLYDIVFLFSKHKAFLKYLKFN